MKNKKTLVAALFLSSLVLSSCSIFVDNTSSSATNSAASTTQVSSSVAPSTPTPSTSEIVVPSSSSSESSKPSSTPVSTSSTPQSTPSSTSKPSSTPVSTSQSTPKPTSTSISTSKPSSSVSTSTPVSTSKPSSTPVSSSSSSSSSTPTEIDGVPVSEIPQGYTLAWHDEFNGNTLNSAYWTHQVGDGCSLGICGWGNGEAQYYQEENTRVADGNMIVTARRQEVGGKQYTSSRIVSMGKVSTTYGYIEARMKLPNITGLWPAFWMLPDTNTPYGGWPHSGEIDIMEARGRLPGESTSALHYSTLDGYHTYQTNTYNFPAGVNGSQYNTYAVEWEERVIKYYVNGNKFLEVPSTVWTTAASNKETAPFDSDFYILFNLAIGGHFDEYRYPDESFTSGEMRVDYVRIFKKSEGGNTGGGNQGGQTPSSSSSSTTLVTPPVTDVPENEIPDGYKLKWHDEFNEGLDTSSWTHEVGDGSDTDFGDGWGCGEAQYYQEKNTMVKNGNLVITAKNEKMGRKSYTSSRLVTKNKVSTTYGYIEARISTPTVEGLNSAFWMLPESSPYGGWPHSGEIDIMQAVGSKPNQIAGALQYSTKDGVPVNSTNNFVLPGGLTGRDYVTYAVEWTPEVIKFMANGLCYLAINNNVWTTKSSDTLTAPFDVDFYLILNLAVGGSFDGNKVPASGFTSDEMKIDYVRIFEKK